MCRVCAVYYSLKIKTRLLHYWFALHILLHKHEISYLSILKGAIRWGSSQGQRKLKLSKTNIFLAYGRVIVL